MALVNKRHSLNEENNMKPAKEVVVLLSRDSRVSRNIRLGWYFEHLNLPISITCTNQHENAGDPALLVLSIVPVPDDPDCKDGTFKENHPNTNTSYYLGTETKVTFHSSGYRFVFGLDLSASLLRVDTFQHLVMVEAVIMNLQDCLVSLIEPYTIPGCKEKAAMKPDVYVSIFAQWHGTCYGDSYEECTERVVQKVIIQGCFLTKSSIGHIMQIVKDSIYHTFRVDDPGKHKSALQKRDDILIGILKTSLVSLRLLPSNTSAGVVIITDGVLGEPDPTSLERLLSQFQNSTTTCSFIHVNPSAYSLCDFGCISNQELMEFIAHSTKGAYLNTFTMHAEINNGMNFYQQSLFPWTFQVKNKLSVETADMSLLLNNYRNCCSGMELRSIFTEHFPPPTLLSCKQDDRIMRAPFLITVSSRLREGYEIRQTRIHNNEVSVHMVLSWWKNCTVIEYRVSSAWPLRDDSPCNIQVYLSGTYEFLLDVSNASKSNISNHWTRPRKLVVGRLSKFFRALMHSDHMLVYLIAFNTDTSRYAISDILRQGQTLYCLPPNSTQFELSSQAQHTLLAFSSFWKPILSLDVNIWQRWLHIHRIEVIMHHDIPLAKTLYPLEAGGRFQSVQCRVAFSQLASLLRDWCTFVLLENDTYVKFTYSDQNTDIPCSFFLVRLSSKSPALVIKLAFLIGLSSKIRKQYVNELRDRIISLSHPGSASGGSSSKRTRHTSTKLSPGIKVNRTHFSASDQPCVTLMRKPVDQLLIRYQHVPNNFLDAMNTEVGGIKEVKEINEQIVRMRDMHWYLNHDRCVLSITNSLSTPLSMNVANALSSFILKVRLAEGYHIAHSSSGIINLVREFPIQPAFSSTAESKAPDNTTRYCLVQFVLFPPMVQSNENSLSAGESEEEDDQEQVPPQNEIHLAMEVWVDPQDGLIKQNIAGTQFGSSGSTSSSSSIHSHVQDVMCDVPFYEELTPYQVTKAVIERDSIYISNIITLEHLQLMCSSDNICHNAALPQRTILCNKNSAKTTSQEGTLSENTPTMFDSNLSDTFSKSSECFDTQTKLAVSDNKNVHFTPCVFDLIGLLEKSSRTKYLFMTVAEDSVVKLPSTANSALLSNFHKSLDSCCDCTVSLSEEDQSSITKHMISRKAVVRNLFERNVTSKSNASDQSKGMWSCYLKQGGNGQVFLILLPASYSDFLKLFSIFDEDSLKDSQDFCLPNDNIKNDNATYSEQNLNMNAPPASYVDPGVFSSSPASEKLVDSNSQSSLHRRISVKRLASLNRESHGNTQDEGNNVNVCKRTMPVFVYNCSMQMLVSSLLQGVRSSRPIVWPDSIQDHRLSTDQSIGNDMGQNYPILSPTKRPSTPRLSTSSMTDGCEDVFPLNSSEIFQLRDFSNTLVDLYYRSFVIGVFAGVRSSCNPFVSTDDLHIATMICQEAVNEIDITEFLLLNCPQAAEFKNQNCQLNGLLPLNLGMSGSALFESDPDIEDICFSSDLVATRKLEQVNMNKSTRTTAVTDPSSTNPTSPICFKAGTDASNDDDVEKELAGIANKISCSQNASLPDGLRGDVGDSDKKSSLTIPLHRKSAFTTVQRNSLRRKNSECDDEYHGSSSSTDENEKESMVHKRKGQKRERTVTTTIPVKRINTKKLNSICLQTGWKNLPEFSLSLLNVPHLRHLSGSNEQVEKRFQVILTKYCHAVSSNTEIYYSAMPAAPETKANLSNQRPDSDGDDIQFEPNYYLDRKQETTFSNNNSMNTPNYGDFRSNRTSYEEEVDDDDSLSSDNGDEVNPLFLCMTCSVRDNKTGNSGTMPVKTLPVNLKEVLSCLEKSCESVDLSQLKVTLDLIWIFLPPASPFEDDQHISLIPEGCSPCVEGVKNSIKWLLEDEIISSLRTCEPINCTTLNKVTTHIDNSKSSNCLMRSVPLQFIFGPEKSMPLFHSEFERLRIDNYKLKKDERFYYLSLERSFVPIPNFDCTPGVSTFQKKHSSPFILSKGEYASEGNYVDPHHDVVIQKFKDNGITWKSSSPFILNQSLSPKTCLPTTPEHILQQSSSEHENLLSVPPTKTNQIQDPSKCISWQAQDHEVFTTEAKSEMKLKRNSLTTDLSSSSFPSRRCTSVSNIPLSESQFMSTDFSKTARSKSRTSLQLVKHATTNLGDAGQAAHRSLRSSLSCGKGRSSPFSPLGIAKGSALSMPVTPLGFGNLEADQFSFPPPLRSDGKQSNVSSRDLYLSPASDFSPRQCSQTTWLGSGYEGEESDMEGDEDYIDLLSDAYSKLPNFWLIISIQNDCANIYFHRRSSARIFKPVKAEHIRIFRLAAENLYNACRGVNQTLLLKKLHDSHLCHPLLVEESQEDIWKKDDYSSVYSTEDNMSDDHVTHTHDYLAATMNFAPGHFECPRVLHQSLLIHHRISGPTPSGTGAGLSALSIVRAFMKNFAVINQKNMFVLQVEDGTVFYCRMHEENKRQDSISSGRLSLLTFDLDQNSSSASMRSSKENLSLVSAHQPRLHFDWYGVHELTEAYRCDLDKLKDSIVKKLDETVLERIALLLSRNPMFKLTPADVMLIQPPQYISNTCVTPKPPNDTVEFSLPSQIANGSSLPSLLYYTHQNLLQFLAVPRYTEPNSISGHFKPVCDSNGASVVRSTRQIGALVPSNLYLFNGITEKGRKGHGIACICLDISCSKQQLSSKACNFKLDYNCKSKVLVEMVDTISVAASTAIKSDDKAMAKFYIWTSGSLKSEELYVKLHSAILHSVCDTITETILGIPLSIVNPIKTKAMKSLRSFDEEVVKSVSANDVTSAFNDYASKNLPTITTLGQGAQTEKLTSFYYEELPLWLQYMKNKSCPTIYSSSTVKFESKASLSQGIINVAKLLSTVLTDSKVFLYYRVEGSDLPFALAGNKLPLPCPGRYYQWLVISRNFSLWRKSTQSASGPSKPNPVTSSLQKFLPHDLAVKADISPCPQHELVMSSSYIPRQHFVYALTSAKSMNVFMYNISQEKCNTLSQLFRQCLEFHTARHHMLQGLTFQKLGLFKHYLVKSHTPGRDTSTGSYTIDVLAKHTRMPSQEKVAPRFTQVDDTFDEIFMDSQLPVPLDSRSVAIKDQVAQYGQQCFTIAKLKFTSNEDKMHLKNLRRKHSISVLSVSTTTLGILLSHARLLHAVSSPILLDTVTRHNCEKLFQQHLDGKSEKGDTSKSQSMLSRTSSFLGTYRRKSGDSLNKFGADKDTSSISSKQGKTKICEYSFQYMADKFTELYAENWKGFIKLKVNASDKPNSKSQVKTSDLDKMQETHYLYRVMPGGIALISHTYLRDHFDVKLYNVDMSALTYQAGMKALLSSNASFMDDCENLKGRMQVHLFSLDMHLRCVQKYLDGNHSAINSGYNLIELLHGLVTCYKPLLENISSQIYYEKLDISCLPLSSHELFGFIVDNSSVFDLRTCRIENDKKTDMCEFVLYYSLKDRSVNHFDNCCLENHRNQNVCIVVVKRENADPGILSLEYFILFTRKKLSNFYDSKGVPDVKPKISRRFSEVADASIARSASLFYSMVPTIESEEEDHDDKRCCKVKMPSFVQCEKLQFEKYMNEIGISAKQECYRQYVWNKLVQTCQDRSSSKALTVVEYYKLLDMMQTESAAKCEPKYLKLFRKHARIKQGQSLQKRLLKQFSKLSALFVSPDSNRHHVCVLSPLFKHVMITVNVDFSSKEVSLSVVLPRPEHTIFHSSDMQGASKELLWKVLNAASTDAFLSWF